MTNNYTTEKFWDAPAGWSDTLTLRQAWDDAVSRTAGHLVARKLRQPGDAMTAARDWLENASECLRKYNPGMPKRDSVEEIAWSYASSKDIEWTMSLHGLLCASAAKGATNASYRPPAHG